MTTAKALLRALLKPLALAVNCLFVPVESIRKSVKLMRPLPALVPMSSVAVPSKGPVPELSATPTLLLPPRPTAETFPNRSSVQTTG